MSIDLNIIHFVLGVSIVYIGTCDKILVVCEKVQLTYYTNPHMHFISKQFKLSGWLYNSTNVNPKVDKQGFIFKINTVLNYFLGFYNAATYNILSQFQPTLYYMTYINYFYRYVLNIKLLYQLVLTFTLNHSLYQYQWSIQNYASTNWFLYNQKYITLNF